MDLSRGDTRMIIDACLDADLLRNQCAYVLATAWHETGGKMKPVSENLNYSADGLRRTFPKYFTADQAQSYARQPQRIANRAYANRMGNGSEASGDGWRYRGRGYPQITGKDNYAKFGIADTPEAALEPAVAIRIMIEGMKRGLFTGKKLSDYITLSSSDFVGARRIINATDKARDIAEYAKEFDRLLTEAGYGVKKKPASAPQPVPAPVEPPKPQTPPAATEAGIPATPDVVHVEPDGAVKTGPATSVQPEAWYWNLLWAVLGMIWRKK